MQLIGSLGTLTIYLSLVAIAHRRGRNMSVTAIACFIAGVISAYAAVIDPLDSLADRALSWHMVQHFLLIGVSAPLLVLGAPLRIVCAALPTSGARALTRTLHQPGFRRLSDPIFAWLQLQAVLFIAHFSPLYEAALDSEAVHAGEHLLFVGSAALFWQSIFAIAPAPFAAPYYVRVLLLVFAIPMSALLGFIFYIARTPWYAHYARISGALQDQQYAGALMWGLGSMPLFVVLLACVAAWARAERRSAPLREQC